MSAPILTAPQFGLWSGIPPRTDNPAAVRPKPPTPSMREQLATLRAEFAAKCKR